MTKGIIAIVLFMAFVIAMLAVSFAHSAAQRRKYKDLNDLLRGIVRPSFDRGRLRSIHVPCAGSLRFAMRPEDERTERMRQTDGLVEIQTGDLVFDRKVYVECEDSRVREWLRHDAEARALIASLAQGSRELRKTRKRLALEAWDLASEGDKLVGLATGLAELSARVPVTTGPDPAPNPHRARLRLVRVVSLVVLLTGLAAYSYAWFDAALRLFPQHVTLAPLLPGAAVMGCALASAAYLLALRAVRGTSHAPRLASELFVTLWIPLVGITVVAAHQYNLKSGSGEEQVEETTITGVYEMSRSRSGRYYFMLPELDEGRIPATSYNSSAPLNRLLRHGQPVRVYWRQGPLGAYVLTRPPEALPDPGD